MPLSSFLKAAALPGAFVGMLFVAVFVIGHDSRRVVDTAGGRQLRFQQMVGGVGMGAVLVPAWNFSDYDPRLQPEPIDMLYPIPGGYSYSPDRLAMVSSFRKPEADSDGGL